MSEQLQASNLFSVKGMVAVITGGATGIGLMMTKALATNGAHKVYIIGRRKEKLEEAAKLSPGIIVPIVGDVTSKDALRSMASQIESEVGYVNLLVCNSGAMGPVTGVKAQEVGIKEYAAAAFAQDWNEFTSVYNVNITAALFTAYAFLELLDAGNKKEIIPKTKSQILITASIASFLKMQNSSMAYGTSKAAVAHVARKLSSELWPFDIRCNAIAPGLFPSDLAASLISHAKREPTEEGAFEKTYIPATRCGDEEDMAGTILYLASRAGAYLNGNILVIDGGRLNVVPACH